MYLWFWVLRCPLEYLNGSENKQGAASEIEKLILQSPLSFQDCWLDNSLLFTCLISMLAVPIVYYAMMWNRLILCMWLHIWIFSCRQSFYMEPSSLQEKYLTWSSWYKLMFTNISAHCLNGENALRMKLWKKRENLTQLIKLLVRFSSVFLHILYGYLLTSFADNYLILGSFISNHLQIWCWFKGQIRKVNMVKLEMLQTILLASIGLF